MGCVRRLKRFERRCHGVRRQTPTERGWVERRAGELKEQGNKLKEQGDALKRDLADLARREAALLMNEQLSANEQRSPVPRAPDTGCPASGEGPATG